MRVDALLYPSLSDRIRYHLYRHRYEIDPKFRFNGDNIVFLGGGRIALGAGSYIGSGSIISCLPGRTITIGKGCHISHRVGLFSNTLKAGAYAEGREEYRYGDISIGDGCWVFLNSYIGPGVTLPPRTVVPANSVVTRSPIAF